MCDVHHTIAVTRIGGHAYRYLTAGVHAGRVVSLFRHGLNVAFEESGSETWIFIQTVAVPLHPWSVEPVAIRPRLSVGARVSSDREGIRLGSSFLALEGAIIDELRIRPYTPEEAGRALSRLPLLERLLAEARVSRPLDPFHPQIDAVLDRWHATSDPSVLADLVGLGIGSTPSGDDALVGLVAGLAALRGAFEGTERDSAALRCALRSEDNSALARTTPASRQALEAALEGSFPEPLAGLIGDLGTSVADEYRIRTSIRSVLGLGATSGASMLRGLCAAWH